MPIILLLSTVKWIFKLKHKIDGSIEWHKACLVAKGFHQQVWTLMRDSIRSLSLPPFVLFSALLYLMAGLCVSVI